MHHHHDDWAPTRDEVRRIVAELRPVIDECQARFDRLFAEARLADAATAGLAARDAAA